MDSEKQKEVVEALNSMAHNQYIPSETLDEFIGKNNGSFRPSKKIFFEKRPNQKDRRDLLFQYLKEIRERELNKAAKKQEEDQVVQKKL